MHSPPPSDVRCSDPRLISRLPILSCNLFNDGDVLVVADFCCCIWVWGCCCWDVVGFLNDVLNPFEGYNGYYRPAIRTQSLLLSLLLYQIPSKRNSYWKLIGSIKGNVAEGENRYFDNYLHVKTWQKLYFFQILRSVAINLTFPVEEKIVLSTHWSHGISKMLLATVS